MNSLFPDQSPLDSIINRSSRPPCKLVEAKEEFYLDEDHNALTTMDRGKTFIYSRKDQQKWDVPKNISAIKMELITDDLIYFVNDSRKEVTHKCIFGDLLFVLASSKSIHQEQYVDWLTPKRYKDQLEINAGRGGGIFYYEERDTSYSVRSSGEVYSVFNPGGYECHPDIDDAKEVLSIDKEPQFYATSSGRKIIGRCGEHYIDESGRGNSGNSLWEDGPDGTWKAIDLTKNLNYMTAGTGPGQSKVAEIFQKQMLSNPLSNPLKVYNTLRQKYGQ
jgi:hypothetical protein